MAFHWWWEAPESGKTISGNKKSVDTEDDEDEEDYDEEEDEEDEDEDEYEDKPEPERTCTFQHNWQDFDDGDEGPDWNWCCGLTGDELSCEKELCPFWKGKECGHPFPPCVVKYVDMKKQQILRLVFGIPNYGIIKLSVITNIL
jgi:hypothetical protein